MSETFARLIGDRAERERAQQAELDKIEGLYRSVFNTEDGRWVLMDILNDLGMWSATVEGVDEVALQNYARLLLQKCGAWQAQRLPDIMASILGITDTVAERSTE
jgi:hypothetical protein